MRESSQTKARTEAWLAGSSLVILAALLLGSSMSYLVHGVAFGIASRLLWISPWIVVAVFAVVFALPFLFSELAEWKDLSELKWMPVWLALLMPAAALLQSRGDGLPLKISDHLLRAILILSALIGVIHFVFGVNPLREWTGGAVVEYGDIRRATGLLRNPIPFGHTMGAFFWVAAVGLLIAATEKKLWRLVYAAVLCFCTFSGVLLSQTRGAWVALAVVAVLSIPFIQGRARRIWMIGLSVVCVLGSIVMVISPEVRSRLISGFDPSQTSNRIRLELWEANFEILKSHPFGIGYNANDKLMEDTFDRLGFEHHTWMGHSHNEFVELAVGSGWIGVGLYLVLTFWILGMTSQELQKAREANDSWVTFLLLSSLLIQFYIHTCALTDQLSTPARYLLSFAWAIVLVIVVERKLPVPRED